MNKTILFGAIAGALAVSATGAWAICADVKRSDLNQAIGAAAGAAAATGGYGLPMWVTVVDETGKICHIATSGTPGRFAGNSEWLGSRIISAQKANTANAFSLDNYVISTANLYSTVQPGGSLYGLQHSNPVNAAAAYLGNPNKYGTPGDPLNNKRIGGVNVFGGGLALYKDGKKIGAVGVSGDTSCRDHANAWRIREALGMHPTPPIVGITTSNMDASGAVQAPLAGAAKGDEMILTGTGGYWDAWSHPACPNSAPAVSSANGTLQAP